MRNGMQVIMRCIKRRLTGLHEPDLHGFKESERATLLIKGGKRIASYVYKLLQRLRSDSLSDNTMIVCGPDNL